MAFWAPPVVRLREHIAVGVDARLLQQLLVKQMVAHLVGGIAEHQRDLFHAHGHAPQHDGKAVAGGDGENHAQMVAGKLFPDIPGDILHRRIISGGPGHHRFRHGHHIPVMKGKPGLPGSAHDTFRHNGRQVVPLPDDGRADPSGNNADSTHSSILQTIRFHRCSLFFIMTDSPKLVKRFFAPL